MDPKGSGQQQLLSTNVLTSHRRTLSLQDSVQPVIRLPAEDFVMIPSLIINTESYTDCCVHNQDRIKKSSLDSCTTSSTFYLKPDGNRDPDTDKLIRETNSGVDGQNKSDVSCLTIFVYTAVVIGIVCSSLFVGRDYIKYVLLSLERSNVCVSFLVFSALFTAVSFPMTWGYILLNVAAGYLYGLLMGVVIVMTCALCGIVCAHHTIRRFLREFVWNRLANDSMRAIVRVVESDSGFKVIVLARLTPIPFGLQNALFAMSEISVQRYVMASFVGMLPSQGLHVYIGSTLRSMEEVISSSPSSSLAYFIFGGQILMACALLAYVIRRAREEFNRTLEEVKLENFGGVRSVETGGEYSAGGIGLKSHLREVTSLS